MPRAQPASMTLPADPEWAPEPHAGYRPWHTSVVIGTGAAAWAQARTDLLDWAVKTRSGFSVSPNRRAETGARYVISARVLGVAIHEPVEVVDVAESDERVGFAHRTLPGHPVDGEEAFIVSRVGDTVTLTVRSLTRPARALGWRLVFPALLIAQRIVRRRYVRALRVERER